MFLSFLKRLGNLLWLGIVVWILAILSQSNLTAARAEPSITTTQPPAASNQANAKPNVALTVFLPFVRGGVPQIVLQQILLGSIPVDLYLGTQSVIDQYLTGMDSWAGLNHSAGRGHSIAGTFHGLEDPSVAYNVPQILNTTWNNGYVAFINVTANGRSAANIANGCCDGAIQAYADAYLVWASQGGNRRAFIAPLQEMNGDWASWGHDPDNFKLAYNRIKNIFESRGVTRDKLWWVFAPNGWTTPPYSMAAYYPGDSNVDIIAYSAYNQSCRAAWETPAQVFQWTDTIRATVSSNKPIFIAQTASASTGGVKDQWIRDAYSYLYQQGIRAVIYFNGNKECDWAVYRPDQGAASQGYKDAVSSPNTHYLAPSTLSATTLPP